MHPATSIDRFTYAAAVFTAILTTGIPVTLAIEQTGDIEVTVEATGGGNLANVALILTGTTLQGKREAATDAEGRFVFRALPPGTYAVDCALSGYQRIQQAAIVLNVGRTVKVGLTLLPGELIETMSVTAHTPLVDAMRTTSQETFDRDFLDRAVPGLAGRDKLSVLATAPGTVGGGEPAVRGSTRIENAFLIDGIDMGDPDPIWGVSPLGPVFDAIQEVQFQTGAFGAEFGRATGGVANVVTKSGGNEFSGSLDLRYSNKDLQQGGDHYDPSEVEYRRSVTELTVGGPLLADKLWFFVAAGDYRNRDAPKESPAIASVDSRSYLGKLTWNLADRHKLVFQYVGNGSDGDNYNASPLVSLEAMGRSALDTDVETLRYVGVLGPRLIVEAQAGRYRSERIQDSMRGDTTTRAAIDFQTGALSRNYAWAVDYERTRQQLSASATWNEGRHTLKGGIDLQRVTTATSQIANGGGYDLIAPDAFGVYRNVISYEFTSYAVYDDPGYVNAVFLQDEWRLRDRLTANLGLRYSTYAYDNDQSRTVYDVRLWEPRLGLAWDVDGDARNVVKATYAWLGQPTNTSVLFYVNEKTLAFDLFADENVGGYLTGEGPVPVDLDGNGEISERASLGSYQSIPPGYARGGRLDGTYIDETTLSYERRLGSASAIGATLVRRRSRDLIEDQYPTEDAMFSVIDNLPGLTRRYDGLELRYEGRFKELFVKASYTLSRSEGNIDMGTSWGCSPEYDYPSLSQNRWGYLPQDTRQAVKLNGYWTLPLGFEIGYGFVYYSGFPWTVLRPTLPYDFDYVGGRGSKRLPAYRQLDFDFKKRFRIQKSDLTLIASVVNALNSQSVTAVNQIEGAAGEPTAWQQPRRFELGMHWSF